MEVPLIGIIITLIFSAFFSAMEIAYISSSRLKVELDKTKGTLNGRILGRFYKNESHFIAMLLLGNNIALVFFGLFAADLLNPLIATWGIEDGSATMLLTQTVMSTIVVLILAEFLPKAFVQLNPNGFLKIMAFPLLVVFILLYLPTFLVLGMSNAFLRILRVENENQEKVFSKVDLEHYVDDLNQRINEEEEFGNEMQILKNALSFDSVKARDCMIPRTDIVSMDVEDTIENLRNSFIETGLSKIIIYRENIDNVIGYVHSFEMFKAPKAIKQILLPINFVPESIPGKELLELFAEKSGNVAVVVDEYGGTSGIVTIEDVIEEIFGEIEDEHDREDWVEEDLGDGEYLFSARVEIDYLIQEYEFELEENEEYETLGGLIIHELESIPDAGTKLALDGMSIIIEEVSDHRIDLVRIILQ
ncbi:MAG: HlyC/CorC family transporter [Flavobacteriales bacterium]|nr:HlyC/CorC family transporter [Flavobacteriales bacterium]